jgi:hypothetical protein
MDIFKCSWREAVVFSVLFSLNAGAEMVPNCYSSYSLFTLCILPLIQRIEIPTLLLQDTFYHSNVFILARPLSA